MKSTREQLRKRGIIEKSDIDKIISFSNNKLIELISSESPTERSASIKVLSDRGLCLNSNIVKLLLDRLSKEKSLYTKIEICEALEKGDNSVANIMTNYLGKIGNNHYKSLPEKVSKKISYPLPRDIIARSLGKMDKSVLPELLKVLDSSENDKLSEVIDAIGFLIFYNQELSSIHNLKYIINTMNEYSNNLIIFWKCIICLSAFHLKETVDILNNIIEESDVQIIRDEAIRSLAIINIKLFT